jgi:ATP-dependent DNA helicase PIF1
MKVSLYHYLLLMLSVSMVDGELFDKFNKIGRIIRRKPDTPFGGIQIIVTGDFFQLPPVAKGGKEPSFCFEAATWNETMHLSVNLTKVFRQSDESKCCVFSSTLMLQLL